MESDKIKEGIEKNKKIRSILHLDYLGIEHCINGIADYLISIPTPSCVGIRGEHGCGKTSFMHLIDKKLEEKKAISAENPVVWIDACEFLESSNIDEDNIGAFIFGKIFRGLNCSDKSFLSKLYKIFSIITNLIFKFIMPYDNKDANMIKDIVDKRKDDAIKLIRTQIQEKIYNILNINYSKNDNDEFVEEDNTENINKKVFVFIDNISKLSESDIVLLFQTVETYLNFKHIQYVFSMDDNIFGVDNMVDIDGGGNINIIQAIGKIFYVIYDIPTNLYNIRDFILKHYPEYVNQVNCDKIVSIIKTFDNNLSVIIKIFNYMDLLRLIKDNTIEKIIDIFPRIREDSMRPVVLCIFLICTLKIKFTRLYNQLVLFFVSGDISFEDFKSKFAAENIEKNSMYMINHDTLDVNEYYKYKKMLVFLEEFIDSNERFDLLKCIFKNFFVT